MAKAADQHPPDSPRIVNRKARHDYHVIDSLEVGIKLAGPEVKSIRDGQVSLAEGFATVAADSLTLTLHQVHIAPYPHAKGPDAPDPDRPRRLLAHRRQIRDLIDQTSSKGRTLVPLTLYFVRGRAKIELGIVEGKKSHDKRQDIKKRDADREIRRGMTRKRL